MSAVAQKLGIKPGTTVAVDGQSVTSIRALLGDLPERVDVRDRNGQPAEQVVLAADGLTELEPMLGGVWNEVSSGGRLWVWYRKGAKGSRVQGSDLPLHRDTLQALLAKHGMDGVTLISVDDTWSAMRVREL